MNLYGFVSNDSVNRLDSKGKSERWYIEQLFGGIWDSIFGPGQRDGPVEFPGPPSVHEVADEAGEEGVKDAQEWDKDNANVRKPRGWAGMESCGQICCRKGIFARTKISATSTMGQTPKEIEERNNKIDAWNAANPGKPPRPRVGGGCNPMAEEAMCSTLGSGWKLVAFWHTHPSNNTEFSDQDKNFSNFYGKPLYKTEPDGSTDIWEPSDADYNPGANGLDDSGLPTNDVDR